MVCVRAYRPCMRTTPHDTEGTLLTLQQVATRLGVGRTTVHALKASGELPVVRLGKRGTIVRVRPEALAAYLAARETQPASSNPYGRSTRSRRSTGAVA